MTTFDLIVLGIVVFTILFGLLTAFLCFRKAFRVAGDKDGELRMFFWAMGGLVGLVVAAMVLAYVLLPVLLA